MKNGIVNKIQLCFDSINRHSNIFEESAFTQFFEFFISDNDCQIPSGEKGSCVPLAECPMLFNLLKSAPRGTPADHDYLRQIGCGFNGRVPLVNSHSLQLMVWHEIKKVILL